MILSGRKIRPYGVALTPSIVDGSRSANTARATYLPPVHRINIFYLLLNEVYKDSWELTALPQTPSWIERGGAGSMGRAPGQGVRGKVPLKLKTS